MADNKAGEDATPPSGPFETPDDLTDVTFVVEDKKLYFYRGVLSLCSPVFKQMLSGDFKEKDAKEIPLPEKKYDHMEAFVYQIHPAHSSTPITDATLEHILPLADEYQVKTLHQKCEQYIGSQLELARLGKNLTVNQVLLYLWLCEEYRLPKYRAELVELGAKNKATDLEQDRFYELLPVTAKCDLMTTRTRDLDSGLYGYRDGSVQDAIRSLSRLSWRAGKCDGTYLCQNDSTFCPLCAQDKVDRVVESVKNCKKIQPPLL